MKAKNIIGILLLAGFGFLVMKSFGSQVGTYTDFDGAIEENRAHVAGTWERDMPTSYNAETNTFSFWMRDRSDALRQVNYFQPKPANFEESSEVFVEGTMEGEVFIAERILIKCPSKYNDEREFRDPDDHPGTVQTGATSGY